MQKSEGSRPRPLVVVAAVIRDGDKILIAQRASSSRFGAGQWEFPGGKLEFGETPEECLVREIKEELNLEIEVEKLFDVVSHVYDDGAAALHVIILGYFAKVVGGILEMREVADARWVRKNEFANFTFASADVPFVERLR